MSDLKPCPFCGGKAEFDLQQQYMGEFRVHCTSCVAQTEWGQGATVADAKADAAEFWNKRAGDGGG